MKGMVDESDHNRKENNKGNNHDNGDETIILEHQ